MPAGVKVSPEKKKMILRLHEQGLTNKQIAEQVRLNPLTIRNVVTKRNGKGEQP